MAEAEAKEQKPVARGFFDKLHPRVMYSAFAFPGYGQWHDGSKIRGALFMGLGFGIFIAGFGAYAVGAFKNQECPMELNQLLDLIPCLKWVSHEAWLFARHWVWKCVLVFVGVYLVSLGEALFVRRHELMGG